MSLGNILIVEDDEDLVRLLEYNLQSKGYLTTSALDGQTASQLIETTNPDLILLDIMLPGMNGWQICQLIRGHERNEISEIPIIMLTALNSAGEKLKGIEMGADDYIPKPFSVKEVLCKVDRLIERQTKKRQLAIEVERLEAKEAQRTNFQDMLFHELRNQLMIIGGYSERIASDHFLSPEKYRRCADVIRDCTHSLSSVTEEMLLLSRLESGPSTLPLEDISFHEVLRHVLKILSRQADPKGIRFHVELDVDLPILRLNATAVRAVFYNLLENAVKYSPQGSAITIRMRPEANTGAILEVENRGPVIPASERDKVFDKFYRGEGVRNGTKGTGLGLYLSKRLVETMGGAICLKESSDQRTCFSVTFPSSAPPLQPGNRAGRESTLTP